MHESSILTWSSKESVVARQRIFDILRSYPATHEETERSLGLFLRGALLARILATAELYQKIVHLPGAVLDVGCWRGQTAVLCENFRAIYEPLHFNRRVIAFDTFEGYAGFNETDSRSELHDNGTYNVGGKQYAELLSELLQLHEVCNAQGHVNGKHIVLQGDIRDTIPDFFSSHPNEFVALAFLDLNSYGPTEQALDAIWQRLIPGGIVAFWQLTRPSLDAEGKAYINSIVGSREHIIGKCVHYPSLCFVQKVS